MTASIAMVEPHSWQIMPLFGLKKVVVFRDLQSASYNFIIIIAKLVREEKTKQESWCTTRVSLTKTSGR